MGMLSRFDVPRLVRKYGLAHCVETGTGRGDSLAYAAAVSPRFDTLDSCEAEPSLAAEATMRFRDDGRVTVYGCRSTKMLAHACLERRKPILFWLDAHFLGADYGLYSYGDEPDDAVRLPLAGELEMIAKLRPEGRDVVLADDLRIYMDGPFVSGNLPDALRPFCPRERSVQFAYDIMGSTHDIRPLFDHEGYLMMTPRESRDG